MITGIAGESEHTVSITIQVKKGMKNYLGGESIILEYFRNQKLDEFSEVGFSKVSVSFNEESYDPIPPAVVDPIPEVPQAPEKNPGNNTVVPPDGTVVDNSDWDDWDDWDTTNSH